MNQEYEIYYLSIVSFESLKKDNAAGWESLFLTLSEDKKMVGITTEQNKAEKIIGYLSQEDGKKYIPYLMKNWSDVYEACVVSINTSQQDISKRVMIAVNIKEKK